jgi:hypothetical protein
MRSYGEGWLYILGEQHLCIETVVFIILLLLIDC